MREICPLIVTAPVLRQRAWQCEPVTVGVPLPRGLVHDAARLSLADEDGQRLPLQASATERWADGSVQWALLDFQVTGSLAFERRFSVHVADTTALVDYQPITLDEHGGSVVVNTGAARFRLRPGTAFPFASVALGNTTPLAGDASALVVTSATGESRSVRIGRVSVEERGHLRTTIRLEGAAGPANDPWLCVVARLQFFACAAAVRVAITIRNPRRARHPGGIWELGDPGSIYLRDVSVHLKLPARCGAVALSRELEADFDSLSHPLELYQDSSGGEQWAHAVHVNRRGAVPCTFRGYEVTSAGEPSRGLRATPAVVVEHEQGRVGLAVQHFWQNFPKSLRVEPDALVYELFSRRFADCHELQGGEQKTHAFTVMFGDDPCALDARHWGRAPAIVRTTPAWYSASGAIPHLSPAAEDADDRYQRLVTAAIDGESSFERKREAADEFGWRHFGDLHADHESADGPPIVSHYNNQYDAVAGFAYQFMRSGDARWQRAMCELATHVADIDVYHTTRDKAAYNHGLFWHTAHHVAAGRSSHRTYPRAPQVQGGGPSNEHNYTSGLRLHWLLTGDRESRDAAVGLAEWVIAMDDGRRTVLRWLAPTDTGLASATRSADFHGPGRGAAHSILALLDGHRLTREARFLDKAEQLIRRCIHPRDDIAARNLLDAEQRWSYTVFLQALGKYLDYKAQSNAIDETYAYARASLLAYARWMAAHEYPYLEKPEILEYPTETWAAQDMRKCEVFLFAAAHAGLEERERLLERARFFFEYSLSTLLASDTRTLTRPVVLLLSNGWMAASGRAPAIAPGAAGDFGAPRMFVPQKARAKQRLVVSATAAATIAILAAMTLLS